MTSKVVLIGAGGHFQVVADAIRDKSRRQEIGGVVDANDALNNVVWHMDGWDICGLDGYDDYGTLRGDGFKWFMVCVGSTRPPYAREIIYQQAKSGGLLPWTHAVIHPDASVLTNHRVGSGSFVGAKAVVNIGAQVSENVIINTGAIVEHHCVIGKHTHIASGAILAGGVEVGETVHIGAGAVIRQGVKIGDRVMVPMGVVVTRDVRADHVVMRDGERTRYGPLPDATHD